MTDWSTDYMLCKSYCVTLFPGGGGGGGGTQHFGIRGRQSDIFGYLFFLNLIFLGQ